MDEPRFDIKRIPVAGLKETDYIVIREQINIIMITIVTDDGEASIALMRDQLPELLGRLREFI